MVRMHSRARRGALLLAASLLGLGVMAGGAIAAGVKVAVLDEDSQDSVNQLDKLLQESTDDTRDKCASGQASAWVSARRARYGAEMHFANASDMCVATLGSIAHAQRLLAYYQNLLSAVGGDPALSSVFPRAIGAAVLNGNGKVSVGNGKAATVTAALAFDAGFTVAYQEGAPQKAVNAVRLKTLTEDCLAQHQDAGTCFSVGYVYGARAFNGQTLSAR